MRLKNFSFVPVAFALLFGIWVLAKLPWSGSEAELDHSGSTDSPKLFVDSGRDAGVSRRPKVRFGSPLETSESTLDIKLEGVTFRVPANHLYGYLQKNEARPGELRSFALQGLGPKFLPRTVDNLRSFRHVGQDSKLVTATISPGCPARSAGGRIRSDVPECTARRWMQVSYEVHASPLVPSSERPDLVVSQPPVLEHRGFRRRDPQQAGRSEFDASIFARTDETGALEFFVCGRKESVPNPGCTHRFIWRDQFSLEVRYVLPLLDDWQLIKTSILAVLDAQIVP